MNVNISGNAVAWHGAIVATVGVIVATVGVLVSIYAIWRKLKVLVRPKVTIAELIKSGYEADVASQFHECTIIDAINVGRRPISLQSGPEYRYKGKMRRCSYEWRPQSNLAAGERAVVIIGQNVDPSQLTDVVVKDTTGKAWKWNGKICKG